MPALPTWLQIPILALAFFLLILLLPKDLDERPPLCPEGAAAPPALDDLPLPVQQPALPPPLVRTWTPSLETYTKLIAFSLMEQGGMLAVPVCYLDGIRLWFAETYGRAILPDEARSLSNPDVIWLNIIGVHPRT